MAGATLMTGCAADPIPVPRSEQYTRDFIKTFGTFDPNHDWNHATQTTVNITTSTPTDVKVYAMVDNVRYLFGTYLGVEGQQTLNVDVPKGTTELIVRANDHDYNVNVGGSVSLSGRADESGPSQINASVQQCAREDWKQFGVDEVLGYRETLPESKVNLGKVHQNFTITATQDFIIYPVFFHTSAKPELGIYYRPNGTTDKEKFIKIPIYFPKQESEGDVHGVTLQKCKEYTWTALKQENWLGFDFASPDFDNAKWEEFKAAFYAQDKDANSETMYWDYYAPGQWPDDLKLKYGKDESGIDISGERPLLRALKWEKPTNAGNTQESYDEAYPYWRSKGIRVSLPKGLQYGFYCVNGATFYSEVQFNEVCTGKDFGNNWTNKWEYADDPDTLKELKDKWANKKGAHFGVYESTGKNGEKRMVLGSEDWEDGDYDLNDIVFYMRAADYEEWPPFEVTDKDVIDVPYTWVIACEDLGTDDFDFNDVVFGVGNYKEKKGADGTAESATVDVTALAAGGTLPVYLHHGGKVIIPEGNTNGGEFHSWFGSNSTNTIINARSYDGPGATATIPVEVGFSMQCCQTVSGEGDSGNMGGFQVAVKHADNVEIIEATNPKAAAAHPDLGKEIGEAPQMICVPTTWLWPVENMMITNVYSAFEAWAKDSDSNKDWHDTRNGSAGSHYVYREVATGGGGSDNPDQPTPGDDSKPLTGEFLGYINGVNTKSVVGMQYTITPAVIESGQ